MDTAKPASRDPVGRRRGHSPRPPEVHPPAPSTASAGHAHSRKRKWQRSSHGELPTRSPQLRHGKGSQTTRLFCPGHRRREAAVRRQAANSGSIRGCASWTLRGARGDQAAACEPRTHSSKPMRPRRALPNGTSERSLSRPPQYRASGSLTTLRGSPIAFT